MLITECEPFCEWAFPGNDLWVLEPCCGGGHIAEALKDEGYTVVTNELYDHGYKADTQLDFLTQIDKWNGDIITNPPYSQAKEFVKHALDIIPDGRKVAMFLKLSFLEGQKRYELFKEYPPKTIYVSTKRINCGKNGDFTGTSAVCYCWFVWLKGYYGLPQVQWFNY